MPKIKTSDGQFCREVPYGADWQRIADCDHQLPVRFGCRQGHCGSCAIQIISGEPSLTRCGSKEQSTLQRKKFPQGCRLACQCAIIGEITFKLPSK